MDAKAEVESIRAAFSSIPSCTADTIAALRRLLDVTDGNKENLCQDSKPQRGKSAQRPLNAASKSIKARQLAKATLQSPKGCLSPKEQQNLATELFNKTLKILTDAVRNPQSRPQNNAGKCGKGQNTTQQAPDRLSVVASCSRLALATLRRIREMPSASNLQLEQGTCALIGRLLSLKLHAHAEKELATLKRLLEHPSALKKSTSEASTPTCADMLCLKLPDTDVARLRLAVQFQTFVLRYLTATTAPVHEESLLTSLDPMTTGSPSWILSQLQTSGTETAEVARSLETLALLLTALARSDSPRGPFPQSLVFRLEVLALQVRHAWWTIAGHVIKITSEVIDPLRHFLKDFGTRSTLAPATHYHILKATLKPVLSWNLFGNLDGDDRRQFIKMTSYAFELAETAGHANDAKSWLASPEGDGEASTKAMSLQKYICHMKKSQKLDERILLDLESCLESCEATQSMDSGLQGDLSTIRRNLTSNIVKGNRESPQLQAMACRIILRTVRICYSSHGRSTSAQSLLESGILASSIWLKCSQASSLNITDLLQEQDVLRSLAAEPDLQKDTALLTTFSDLQWHLHRFLRGSVSSKRPTAHTHAETKLLTSAVNVLATLRYTERETASLVNKSVDLVSTQISSQLYNEACQSLAKIFKHMAHDGGVVSNLTLALVKSPLPQALSQCDSDGVFQNVMALTRRLGKDWKQPCLEKALGTVNPPHVDTIYYVWVMIATEEEAELTQADFHACASRLMIGLGPTESPVRRMQVCRRILEVSFSQSSWTDAPLVRLAIACQPLNSDLGGDVELTRYADHIERAWKFARAMSDPRSDIGDLTELLEWWDKAAHSSLGMQDIDDVDALARLLLHTYPLLELRGLHSLAKLAIQITDRLCTRKETSRLDKNLSFGVSLAKSRVALTDGDVSTAQSCLAEATCLQDLPEITLSERLQLAELTFQAASISSSREEVFRSLNHALIMTNTSGLRRVDKLKVFKFQAKLGCHLAFYLHRKVQDSMSAPVARGSLLLLKSVAATVSDQKSDSGTQTERSNADESVGSITASIAKLGISEETDSGSLDIAYPGHWHRHWQIESQAIDCLLLLTQISSSLGNKEDAQHYLTQAERSVESLGLKESYKPFAIEDLRLQVCSGESRQKQPAVVSTAISQAKHADIAAAAFNLAQGEWCARFEGGSTAFDYYALAEKFLVSIDGSLASPSSEELKPRTKAAVKKSGGTAKQTKRSPREATAISKTQASKKSRAAGSTAENAPTTKTASDHNFRRTELITAVHCQRALAFMKDDNLTQAAQALSYSLSGPVDRYDIRFSIVHARLGLAQAVAKLLMDVNYSTLLESTLAVPSVYCGRTNNVKNKPDVSAVVKPSKAVKSKQAHANDVQILPESFVRDIGRSEEADRQGMLSQIYEISAISLSAGMLSLAINGPTAGPNASQMASMLEMPSCEAFRRQVLDVRSEAQKDNLVDLLRDAAISSDQHGVISASAFQDQFVDIIPQNWVVASVTMNEEGTELWVGRYARDHSPVVVRLPMTRSRDQDMEEELSFDFHAARVELNNIIKASDYSCHHPPDATVKGGKSKWWQDRENLDERMHDLLKNMESIWFGGFKSLLSIRQSQPDLLARFQKSLEIVLDKHLPSRRVAKPKVEKVVLHPQIVFLFLGLDIDDQDGIDDHVMDLLFFVVDVLQCNGEANAYDEVDFDAMAVETLAAMQAYHDAAVPPETDDAHLILRLDKRLHCFPWESMPCLQGLSISRVSSLNQLRERLLLMQGSLFTTPRKGGTYMLNPSGDLSRTETTLSPALTPLVANDAWTSSVRNRPDEKSFTATLSSSSAFLYFGHGSGAQYVRPRAIERLPSCSPVVWLMGCSSGSPTENGQLETTSVPLSYLAAGRPADEESKDPFGAKGREGLCMSVVATLWDVTDRDIDKFSLAVGERWGLFPPGVAGENTEASTTLHPPKTPKGKRKDALLLPGGSAMPPKTPAKTTGKVIGKTPAETPAKTPGRIKKVTKADAQEGQTKRAESLTEAVAKSRDVCYLRYLNGAASVVYGVPVYLEQ